MFERHIPSPHSWSLSSDPQYGLPASLAHLLDALDYDAICGDVAVPNLPSLIRAHLLCRMLHCWSAPHAVRGRGRHTSTNFLITLQILAHNFVRVYVWLMFIGRLKSS